MYLFFWRFASGQHEDWHEDTHTDGMKDTRRTVTRPLRALNHKLWLIYKVSQQLFTHKWVASMYVGVGSRQEH